MKTALLSAICLAVLCVILALGLWPFHTPRNQVAWLKGSNGLAFGRSGTVISPTLFLSDVAGDETQGTSIEIWTQPLPYQDSSTLLHFYASRNPHWFRLSQSLTDLRLQIGLLNGDRLATETDLYVPEVFRQAKPTFLTVTSGLDGTMVYVGGILVARASATRILRSTFSGQLFLGDSPRQPDSWRGQVYGLAVYDTELTTAQVQRHHNTWTRNGRPEVYEAERTAALYLLDERQGQVAHNKMKPGVDLFIPEKYMVVDKVFLEPFWREFNMSRSYWSAVLKNVVGFIPFGFCFYPYLSAWRMKRTALLTVVFGAIVSLTIEVLQSLIPTRDSGMSDIITNTIGTYGGVLLYLGVNRFLSAPFHLASYLSSLAYVTRK